MAPSVSESFREMLCPLFQFLGRQERRRETDTQPNVYSINDQRTREKKREKREHTSMKKGQRTIMPDHRCQDITSYPVKKRFSIRSRIFLSKKQ